MRVYNEGIFSAAFGGAFGLSFGDYSFKPVLYPNGRSRWNKKGFPFFSV